VQQSVTNFMPLILKNLVTLKVLTKHELLFFDANSMSLTAALGVADYYLVVLKNWVTLGAAP
jgi:hypothetical protein